MWVLRMVQASVEGSSVMASAGFFCGRRDYLLTSTSDPNRVATRSNSQTAARIQGHQGLRSVQVGKEKKYLLCCSVPGPSYDWLKGGPWVLGLSVSWRKLASVFSAETRIINLHNDFTLEVALCIDRCTKQLHHYVSTYSRFICNDHVYLF